MVEPCIKGVVIRISADRVRAMLETGKLREEDLERWLTARDVELVSEPPRPTLWYPIETMSHLLELMRDVEGAGDERYLAAEAAREIDNVLRAPAMAAVVHGARAFGKRAGVALVKLTNLTFNFGRWTYSGEDLENFTVEAAGVEAITRPLQLSIEGFIGALASRMAGRPVQVTSERPAPGSLRYRGAPHVAAGRP